MRGWLLDTNVISELRKSRPSSAVVEFVAAQPGDSVVADGGDPHWRLFDELTRLDTEIVATQAVTMEGLCVKARAACWALLGDIDPEGQETTDKRMALSIVRDLIRLFVPDLERPGAMTSLVDGIEKDACRSTAAM